MFIATYDLLKPVPRYLAHSRLNLFSSWIRFGASRAASKGRRGRPWKDGDCMGRSVFGKPFAAHSKLKTMVRAIGEASLVETEDELDGIKQTVPAKRIRSLALAPLFFLFSFLPFSLFLSSRSSSSFVNFLPVLFSPRRVTFYATSRSGIVFSWLLILVFLPFYSRRSCVPSVLQKARAASTFSPVATFCLGRWYFEVSSSLSELRLSILNIRLA